MGDDLTEKIIGEAVEVHKELGPGRNWFVSRIWYLVSRWLRPGWPALFFLGPRSESGVCALLRRCALRCEIFLDFCGASRALFFGARELPLGFLF